MTLNAFIKRFQSDEFLLTDLNPRSKRGTWKNNRNSPRMLLFDNH